MYRLTSAVVTAIRIVFAAALLLAVPIVFFEALMLLVHHRLG